MSKNSNAPFIRLLPRSLLHLQLRHIIIMMQVFVKGFDGRTHTLEVEHTDTVLAVKFKIFDLLPHLPPHKQLLHSTGRMLDDARTLREYDIEREATLHLMHYMRPPEPLDCHISARAITAGDANVDVAIAPWFTFDESVRFAGHESLGDAATSVISLRNRANPLVEVAGTTAYDEASRTLSFTPRARLPRGARFYAVLFASPHFTGEHSNRFAPLEFSFST